MWPLSFRRPQEGSGRLAFIRDVARYGCSLDIDKPTLRLLDHSLSLKKGQIIIVGQQRMQWLPWWTVTGGKMVS